MTLINWLPWIPFTVVECAVCSALVRDDREAKANHEAWHATPDFRSKGAGMTSSDPEPGVGAVVRDCEGRLWHRFHSSPRSWMLEDENDDAETWTRVAGNYGPVTLIEAP